MGGPSEKGSAILSFDTMRGVRAVRNLASQYRTVYLSPNGSTRSVARALAEGLSGDDSLASLTDLADAEASASLLDAIRGDGFTCLLVGSPVYFNRAVPPVMAFIEKLPPSDGRWAVPFVTYGKACSGVALWQMASALQAKGYQLAGAAKVQAVHSMMWESRDPVGVGHPDEAELERIRQFAETLGHRFETGTIDALSLQALDYHPEELTAELRPTIGKPWPVMPKYVDGEVCTECGTCADECPVSTITLNPLPEFGPACIDCFNCVRLCPEGAIIPETPWQRLGRWSGIG